MTAKKATPDSKPAPASKAPKAEKPAPKAPKTAQGRTGNGKAPKAPKAAGVMQTIIELAQNRTRPEIFRELVKRFPDREPFAMATTLFASLLPSGHFNKHGHKVTSTGTGADRRFTIVPAK